MDSRSVEHRPEQQLIAVFEECLRSIVWVRKRAIQDYDDVPPDFFEHDYPEPSIPRRESPNHFQDRRPLSNRDADLARAGWPNLQVFAQPSRDPQFHRGHNGLSLSCLSTHFRREDAPVFPSPSKNPDRESASPARATWGCADRQYGEFAQPVRKFHYCKTRRILPARRADLPGSSG